jgi:ETC complex I subunit conserved region
MSARIYQPAKNAMTSGQAKTHGWVLEFEPDEARQLDPLMGWTGSGDTQSQVRLTFPTLDEAKAYAERHGIMALVTTPQKRKTNVRMGGYGENFATARKEVWTH